MGCQVSKREIQNYFNFWSKINKPQENKVLYMSFSFWLLGVVSRDFSQAEKKTAACKAEQIHKMTAIFTQKSPARLSF